MQSASAGRFGQWGRGILGRGGLLFLRLLGRSETNRPGKANPNHHHDQADYEENGTDNAANTPRIGGFPPRGIHEALIHIPQIIVPHDPSRNAERGANDKAEDPEDKNEGGAMRLHEGPIKTARCWRQVFSFGFPAQAGGAFPFASAAFPPTLYAPFPSCLMNITLESQPNCRAILRIEIPAADVQKQREQVTGNYARQVRVPGFRPGKAPKQVVAKRYEREIGEEVQTALVRLGYTEAEKRDDVDILRVVGVRDQSMHPDNHFTFTLEVSTAPKFELPEYKGIPVKLPRVEVTDADVDHDLLHLQERYQTFNDVEREAQLGDYVVLHAKGTVDGTPIEEAHPGAPAVIKKIEGNWFELEAEEKFLPGFFAGLVGIKKDETRDVSVVLPEDFSYEALRGKTIVLQAKCDSVKEGVVPELNDDFAKKINAEWDLERLRNEVRIGITQRREQSRDEAKANQVIQHLAEKLEFELPQDMVNQEAQRRTNDIAMNAMRQGMEQDKIMEVQEQIVSAASQQARQGVKVSFILGEVAKKENITVREEQVRQALFRIAAQQRVQPKKLIADAQKNGMIERLHEDILLQNAVQFLKDNAAVEEVEPEKEDCGHDHSH